MSKYLKLPIADQLATGTTDGISVAFEINLTTATFITDGVSVGDYAYNDTDDTSAVVTAVNSETSLTVSLDVFPTAKAFIILSASASQVSQLVDSASIVLATQTTTDTTVLQTVAAANDTVTITHTLLALPLAQQGVQAGMELAASPNSRPKPSQEVILDGAVIISVTVA